MKDSMAVVSRLHTDITQVNVGIIHMKGVSHQVTHYSSIICGGILFKKSQNFKFLWAENCFLVIKVKN